MLKLRFSLLSCVIGIVTSLFLSLSNGKNNSQSDNNITGSSFPKFKLPYTVISSLKTSKTSQEIILGETNIIHFWSANDSTSREQQKSLTIMNVLGGNIIGINIDKNLKINNKNYKKLPYKVNINDKKGRLAVKLGVKDTPATFLTDRNGIIRYQIFNELSGDSWLEEIESAYKILSLEPYKK